VVRKYQDTRSKTNTLEVRLLPPSAEEEKEMKARIIKRTDPVGNFIFVIQQKHFLFRWRWVDAWVNSLDGACCNDSFNTIEEAKWFLPYFDGTETKEIVVEETHNGKKKIHK